MLEIIEHLQGIEDYNKIKGILLSNKEVGGLAFLRLVIEDKSQFFSVSKCFRMMQYFDIEGKDTKLEDIGEIGEYACDCVNWLKRQTQHSNSNDVIINHDIPFLTNNYNKLRRNVSNKQQYYILRKCMIYLNDNDKKWLVRILCKKVEWHPNVLKAIREIEGG